MVGSSFLSVFITVKTSAFGTTFTSLFVICQTENITPLSMVGDDA